LYILKHVLHDWDDDRAVQVLANCRRAMGDDSRVVIIEMVVPNGPHPHLSKVMDISMMVFQDGGRERAEPEFRALCATAGLVLTRCIPTALPMSVLEARPVGAKPVPQELIHAAHEFEPKSV
jgi:hypothetical protein